MYWLRIAPVLLAAVSLSAPVLAQSPINGVEGAWHPEIYTLEDGTEQKVTGLIFFTEDDRGGLERGAGEGGTYTLEGDRLVFTHLYHLSGGSTPLKMSAKSPEDAELEPCRIELAGEILTIFFPSGNRMTFRRSSG